MMRKRKSGIRATCLVPYAGKPSFFYMASAGRWTGCCWHHPCL